MKYKQLFTSPEDIDGLKSIFGTFFDRSNEMPEKM